MRHPLSWTTPNCPNGPMHQLPQKPRWRPKSKDSHYQGRSLYLWMSNLPATRTDAEPLMKHYSLKTPTEHSVPVNYAGPLPSWNDRQCVLSGIDRTNNLLDLHVILWEYSKCSLLYICYRKKEKNIYFYIIVSECNSFGRICKNLEDWKSNLRWRLTFYCIPLCTV